MISAKPMKEVRMRNQTGQPAACRMDNTMLSGCRPMPKPKGLWSIEETGHSAQGTPSKSLIVRALGPWEQVGRLLELSPEAVDNSVGDLGAAPKKAHEIVAELDCRNITQKLNS